MPLTQYDSAIVQPPMNRYGIEHSAPNISPCTAATIAQMSAESFFRISTAAMPSIGQRYQ